MTKALINLKLLLYEINSEFYKKKSWVIFLTPLSFFFFLLIKLRKFLYISGLFKSIKLTRPIVIIGNITLGGTGKTSLIQKIVIELKKNKISVGVISRGYGSSSKKPREVFKNSLVQDVGDEPLLLKKKLDIPVFIGKDKASVAKLLIDQYPNVQILLSDDGLQHYKLKRDLEICIIDGERGLGNKRLLPSGPLREPVSRLSQCDLIILNGKNSNFEYDYLMSYKNPNYLKNRQNQKIKLHSLKGKKVFIMSAIGNPYRLIKFFKSLSLNFKYKFFDDHYFFKQDDFNGLEKKMIVMTEKDIIKCQNINHDNIWYLPLSVEIEAGFMNEISNLTK